MTNEYQNPDNQLQKLYGAKGALYQHYLNMLGPIQPIEGLILPSLGTDEEIKTIKQRLLEGNTHLNISGLNTVAREQSYDREDILDPQIVLLRKAVRHAFKKIPWSELSQKGYHASLFHYSAKKEESYSSIVTIYSDTRDDLEKVESDGSLPIEKSLEKLFHQRQLNGIEPPFIHYVSLEALSTPYTNIEVAPLEVNSILHNLLPVLTGRPIFKSDNIVLRTLQQSILNIVGNDPLMAIRLNYDLEQYKGLDVKF